MVYHPDVSSGYLNKCDTVGGSPRGWVDKSFLNVHPGGGGNWTSARSSDPGGWPELFWRKFTPLG